MFTSGSVADTPQERILGAAARARAAHPVQLDRRSSTCQLATAVRPRHRVAHGGLDEAPEERRLMDDVGDLMGRLLVAQINQQAMDRGERDALVGGQLARVQPPHRVHPHALGPRPTRRDHLDHRLPEPAHAVQGTAREVTERSAARERRRQPLALARECRLPDHVDPAIPPVQQAPLDTVRDRSRSQHAEQLHEGDERVLAGGDRRDPGVDGGGCSAAFERR